MCPSAALCVASVLLCLSASAQCGHSFAAGFEELGVDGAVRSVLEWDPDGGGPMAPRLVIAGDFYGAHGQPGGGVAWLDGDLWRPFAHSLVGDVRAAVVDASGDLVLAGSMNSWGSYSRFVRWDASGWQSIGGGVDNTIRAMVMLPNGDLVIGGKFANAGGQPMSRIARWDGAAWHPLGSGMPGFVNALAVLPNGDLVASGYFSSAGGVAANGIARWDGQSWHPLGAGFAGLDYASSMVVDSAGDLVVVGRFVQVGGLTVPGLARWDGSAWHAFAGVPAGEASSVTLSGTGDLLVGFRQPPSGSGGLYRWTGAGFQLEVATVGEVMTTLPRANGDLVIGGRILSSVAGLPTRNVATRTGGVWDVHGGGGVRGQVYCAASLPDGRVAVGGVFSSIGLHAFSHLAVWDGTDWQQLLGAPNGIVDSITVLANGDLVAGGNFTSIAGVPCNHIARWDGTTWHALGVGVNGSVEGVLERPNGDLWVAGGFSSAGNLPNSDGIARWDGQAWHAMPGLGPVASGRGFVERPNGDVVAFGSNLGGWFDKVAVWDGAQWSPVVGQPDNTIYDAIVLQNGDVLFGGLFDNVAGVPSPGLALWNGTTWSTVGAGMTSQVNALQSLPDGDVLVGGSFIGGITRLDGGSLASAGFIFDGTARELLLLPDGRLLVGGSFGVVQAASSTTWEPSASIAFVESDCAPSIDAYGPACQSSGGNNELVGVTPPWLGGVMEVRAEGLPATAIVVTATGFSGASVPLGTILTPSPSGCQLLVTPALLDASFVSTGALTHSLPIPNQTPLIGAELRQQMISLELGATQPWVEVTSTNGLTATLGTF